ncbi:MAG TPA: TMEM175 family protein [Thermoanaerobaculia bacterium]|nr:TMEM175 family protein [Thermoanaerobaculia bacterium]
MTRSIRRRLAEKGVGASEGFRWRGSKEVSRLEGLSDAVFAFAITLLVVSLEVPKTFDELMMAMRGFFAFSICFALLFSIWYQQYVFFRRYGLEDLFVVWMNAILIFVVLFYVYPLKFLFTGLVDRLLGFPPRHGGIPPLASFDQLRILMLVFGAGYVAVFLLFFLLYRHADRRREQLELNEVERLHTRESIWTSLLQVFVGVASLLIAGFGGPRSAPWAGIIYMANGPLQAMRGMYWGRRRRLVQTRVAAG